MHSYTQKTLSGTSLFCLCALGTTSGSQQEIFPNISKIATTAIALRIPLLPKNSDFGT